MVEFTKPTMTDTGNNQKDLNQRVKEVMIEELMLQEEVADIADDAPLFDPEGIALDSVDALQLVVGLEKNFALKISDAEAAKEILQDVNSIVAAIQAMER